MKKINSLIALAIMFSLLTACGGETSSDQPLPKGTSPSDAALSDTSSDPSESGDESPEPAGINVPDITTSTEADREVINPEELIAQFLEESERTTIPGLSYILPEGWTVGPKKQMRLLTLIPPAEFKGAELSVFKFPGDVGGFSSNVTRWAGQVGIQFVKPPARSDYEAFDIDGVSSTWIPLVGGDRAVVAVWVPIGADPDKPTDTWTLKLNCAAGDAEKLSPAMRAWAESIEFTDEP